MHLVQHLWRLPYESLAAPVSDNMADPVALNVFAQIQTAIPNWFTCGSFAILNSSVTVLVWNKSGVASEPCLRCLTLGLVWYALIYTEGSPSFFSLMKLYLLQPFHFQSYICCTAFSFPNQFFAAELSNSVMLLTFWGVLDKRKF